MELERREMQMAISDLLENGYDVSKYIKQYEDTYGVKFEPITWEEYLRIV